MNRHVIFRPEAERELSEAYRWYQERSPALGEEFLRCIDACIESIHRNPRMYPAVHEDIHRALVRRFPFGVFYLIRQQKIVILAVFHASRDPDQWRKRR